VPRQVYDESVKTYADTPTDIVEFVDWTTSPSGCDSLMTLQVQEG